ncbi:MAG: glycerophosphodiester phosphodiesterase [SAR324 cluster bacterium]|nr:glycerophosphodiester phosphodiesterase [SAR324 cluster bacterium]
MQSISRLLGALMLAWAWAALVPPGAWGAPLVIGHRGAPGYLPEHTLASYALAIRQGADYIEPDLVSTRDGVLIARHENEISGTSDVAEKFPARRSRKVIDGRARDGWFTEDFTLAEIKTLRARERLPFRGQSHNGRYAIPTLAEIIALAKRMGGAQGRVIGLYPETKHPSYFAGIGLSLEEPLVELLHGQGYRTADAPVFIQSFEVGNLKKLRGMTRLRLVQLLGGPSRRPYDLARRGDPRTYGDMSTPRGLREIAAYAQGIGPWKGYILPRGPSGRLQAPTTLVDDAHQAGLLVHPYTFRNEARYLAKDYGGDPLAEYRRFFGLGVDGVFSDFPDTAVKARADMR